MNISQLSHLVALLEAGSFTRAAEASHLSQSAFSRSIQLLEGELGAPLIDRIGKRNEATLLGTSVATRARRVLLEVEEIKREAEMLARGEGGTVKLGLGAAPSALFSVPLMQHLLSEYPRLRAKLSRGPTESMLLSLRERALDALIVHVRTLDNDDDLEVRLMPGLVSGFVCRPGHPLLSLRSPQLADVLQYPLVSTGLSSDVKRRVADAMKDKASGFELHLECGDIAYLLDIVEHSDAVFLGVLATALSQTEAGRLVELPASQDFPVDAAFAFVTLRGRSESPAMRIARQFCFESLQSVQQTHLSA